MWDFYAAIEKISEGGEPMSRKQATSSAWDHHDAICALNRAVSPVSLRLMANSNHRVTIRETYHLPVEVEFEVEFDASTGEAEIIGMGHVVANPETMTKRNIMRLSDIDNIDDNAWCALIGRGTIPRPHPGETVMLHGEKYIFNVELLDGDDPIGAMKPAQIIECLETKSDYDDAPKIRRRRRFIR